jgi:hypothetical protein
MIPPEENLDRLSNIITGARRMFKSVPVPVELVRWAVDRIKSLYTQLGEAHTNGFNAGAEFERRKSMRDFGSFHTARGIVDDWLATDPARRDFSMLKADIQIALERAAHTARLAAEAAAAEAAAAEARTAEKVGTYAGKTEWSFETPTVAEEDFYCVIGPMAYGRTFKRTLREAIDHATPMFKNSQTKKLLVVRVERVLEPAAPPITERAPVAEDFPR